jgi:hypothetical protein
MKGGVPMFQSFNVKFPEYEVITPQTHSSYTLRSLNVQEEERLKGSLMTPSKVHEHLNKCIYDAVVSKPDAILDYDHFLKQVTLKDRDALLYGLYHISYEEIRNYDVTCSSCRKEYPVTVQASSTFNYNKYPGKDVLAKRIAVELPRTTGVVCFIKQPSLYDEMVSMRSLSVQPGSNMDVITETLVIERFQQDPEGGDTVVYSERGDVVDAYMSLPARDKRVIHEAYRKNFGEYGISLKMRSTCSTCGEQEDIDIDLVTNFFRMVYTI